VSEAELSLIEAIARRLPAGDARLIHGIGDDAAVVRSGPISLTSVDAVVQDVHFRLGEGLFSHEDVGFKALASALSDIAAMGVGAGEAYLVLGACPGLSQAQALQVIDGVCELAGKTGVSVAGGDVVRTPVLTLAVTVVGWTDSAAQPVYRSGAAAGDLVGVTGTLGGAAAGVALMDGRISLPPQDASRVLTRARRPRPRLKEGLALAGAGAHAMIDLSDGLASDAAHLAKASAITLEIDLSSLPLEDGVEQAASQLGIEPARLAAGGGEDYELCFCAPPSDREKIERTLIAVDGAGVRWIGEALPAGDEPPTARFRSAEGFVRLHGYQHRW
jgi:thiamine-monophosphate kinase